MGQGTIKASGQGHAWHCIDARAAYAHAVAHRAVYARLPAEVWAQGQLGRLPYAMHGARDTAHNWAVAVAAVMHAAR